MRAVGGASAGSRRRLYTRVRQQAAIERQRRILLIGRTHCNRPRHRAIRDRLPAHRHRAFSNRIRSCDSAGAARRCLRFTASFGGFFLRNQCARNCACYCYEYCEPCQPAPGRECHRSTSVFGVKPSITLPDGKFLIPQCQGKIRLKEERKTHYRPTAQAFNLLAIWRNKLRPKRV